MKSGSKMSKSAPICFLLALLFMACPSLAKDKSKTVMARGVAAIKGENITGARQAALENALRNAIEQGLGTMMDARAIVQNDQLLEEIYTHTRGYVPEYDVIREQKAEGSLYRVTISAMVKTAKLRNQLARIGIIKQMMNYPRLAILPGAQNMPSDAVKSAGHAMAGFFTDRRFDVVTEEMANPAQSSGEAASKEPVALGRARHAEIVVIYGLTAEPANFDGVMEHVPVDLSARAVVTSTGQLLSSEQVKAFGLGDSEPAALKNGAQKAGRKLAAALSEDIAAWWAEYTANGLPYHIVLKTSSKNARQVAAVQKSLRSVPGVVNLAERSSGQGLTKMRVTYKGRTAELKQQILKMIPDLQNIMSKGRYMELKLK